MGNLSRIPSKLSYSPCSFGNEAQWGTSLSEDAVVLENTKLELEVQDTKFELRMILNALEGMKNRSYQHLPNCSCKSAEEVVTDYLAHIFGAFEQYLSKVQLYELLKAVPAEIVFTIPTVSSRQ